jgi:hypothetical protein
MKWFDACAVFASGCVATILLTWLVPVVRAQGNEYTSDAIKVCVAGDGVLRMVDLAAGCADGQRTLLLRKRILEGPPAPSADDAKPGTASVDTRKLDELERRLKDLEGSPARRVDGNSVVAPFEVVDRTGRRVFYVDAENGPPRAELLNREGKVVATMGAPDGGGQFTTHGTSANLSVYLGIFGAGKGAGVTVLESGVRRTELGRDGDTGRFRLKIFGSGGALVAGIGEEATKGGGLAVVNDGSGNPRAAMGVNAASGKGFVLITNRSKTEVATLTEGSHAGGLLTINDAAGRAMVEAGVTGDGIGVVRTGPEGFKPGYGVLGLPASSISGKK